MKSNVFIPMLSACGSENLPALHEAGREPFAQGGKIQSG
jgi:hypothetical protein